MIAQTGSIETRPPPASIFATPGSSGAKPSTSVSPIVRQGMSWTNAHSRTAASVLATMVRRIENFRKMSARSTTAGR